MASYNLAAALGVQQVSYSPLHSAYFSAILADYTAIIGNDIAELQAKINDIAARKAARIAQLKAQIASLEATP
jgi:hypothetical protein